MRRAPLTFTLGTAILLVASPMVSAMGFGRTVTATTLGQPLNFSASVSLESDESLPRECVGANVFVGEAMLPAPNVRVTLEPARDGIGRIVRVTTATLIDEPIVTVEVSIGCNSRVSRRFVTFIDPPLVYLAQAQGDTPAPQRGVDTRTAPILEAARSGNAGRRGAGAGGEDSPAAAAPRAQVNAARRPERSERQSVASAGSATINSARRQRPPRAARPAGSRAGTSFAAAPSRGAPRLKLEAPPLIVAAATPTTSPSGNVSNKPVPAPLPSLPAISAATAPAAAAQAASQPLVATTTATPVATPASEGERERMQVLEAGLARLIAESQANRQAVATLQARLRQAETDRYANGLVYALGAGLIFFAALAAAFWAVRPRQRQRARWFDAAANQQARAQRNPAPSARSDAPASATAAAPAEARPTTSRPAGPPVTAPAQSTIGGLEVTTVLGPELLRRVLPAEADPYSPDQPAAVRRSGSMSMEELIDLEQQAEFFVVLGQDEAAIDLLAAHVCDGAGVSPLPFLKLLEIHQRRGDQPAYERVRESFQERFDAFAPDWKADLQRGRSLDEYPQTIARLQALWSTPMQAMQVLDSLLFRRSEADEAFDFPAYRELLFLYSVARELAGNVDTELGPIDLFLPLDEFSPGSPDSVHGLDVDVASLQPDAGEEFVIRRSLGRRGAG